MFAIIELYAKVIHIHLVLRKIFITLFWNDKQSFYIYHFHIIFLPVLFCAFQISIHCFIIHVEFQYNHVLTLSGFLSGGVWGAVGDLPPPLSILRILFYMNSSLYKSFNGTINDNMKFTIFYTTIFLGFLVQMPTIVSNSSSDSYCGALIAIFIK